jgi:hypothetical protein
MPAVREALQRMEREFAIARKENARLLKFVHGYGSRGQGGDICLAVQKTLLEMVSGGKIRVCIFGENWAKSDAATWQLLKAHPELKDDPDLGRGNRGITIVVL